MAFSCSYIDECKGEVSLKEKLQSLIDREDKKNPYTDEALAQQLSISRAEVMLLRQKSGIADSRERRKIILLKTIEQLLIDTPQASERIITQLLLQKGFSVSRFSIGQLLKNLKNTSKDRKKDILQVGQGKSNLAAEKFVSSAFDNIIGKKGSLFPAIEQAKAAILYPPGGLRTLLLGATGVGKSDLAEAMYRFAVDSGKLTPQAPFIVFNCADYADNPQLLLSQLFGHAKGAFTGAERPKEGLIEKADGGILFLDEVHRLPPEGQEILFYLIDKGKFRRLGETESLRKVTVMLIAATTEDPAAALLATFRRRMPMVIELPSLQERPLKERLCLIRYFFKREAQRTGSCLTIEADALKALLLYDCSGNIGQLSGDIQVACAKGFLNLIGSGDRNIPISITELPKHARRGLLKIRHQREKLEKLRITNCDIFPGEGDAIYADDLYSLPREIYSYIEEQHKKLSLQSIPQEEINRLIGLELEAKFLKWVRRVDESAEPLAKSDIYKVVGKPMVDIVEHMLQKAGNILNGLDEQLIVGLSIHLAATLERLKQDKIIINPHLTKTKKEYAREFAVAREMADYFTTCTGVKLPEEEIGFITLYLTMHSRQEVDGRVGILVLSHGHVAAGMAEVANRLLGVNQAKAVEMSLDENPEIALERTIETVTQIDEGKGVLLLVDMGSLASFGPQITALTGIPVRSVGPVYTMMVIEAVRRVLLPGTILNELADSLGQQHMLIPNAQNNTANSSRPVILTVCITGEGAAIQLQKNLERLLGEGQAEVDIISLGLADRQKFSDQVREIALTRSVKAVVGTLNPGLPGIPFLTPDQILSGSVPLLFQRMSYPDDTRLTNVIQEDLIFFPGSELTKPEILDLLADSLLSKNLVESGFVNDVVKRELIGVPVLNKMVAIPHGDPRYVKKTSIALAIFPEPIPWGEGYQVQVVCLLALSTDGKEIIQDLAKRISHEETFQKLLCAKKNNEVKEILVGD
jgi:transcriptional regulator with AAA-type ATPase domain/transcriptional regulatory protein LevR